MIRIHADNAGTPIGGIPLASFAVGDSVNRVDSGFDLFTRDIYEYSADINFTMTASTTYWYSIDGNTVNDLDDNFNWTARSGAGNSRNSVDGGGSWGF